MAARVVCLYRISFLADLLNHALLVMVALVRNRQQHELRLYAIFGSYILSCGSDLIFAAAIWIFATELRKRRTIET